jgi:putative ubiquitin-RnfH superfamily antitoxin RatB of RatAB toxin-antitoxin module
MPFVKEQKNYIVSEKIQIEVAYALPQEQVIITLAVAKETSIEEAIKASKIIQKYPDIDLKKQKVGIFSKAKKLNQTLQAGDRIEIYRPLIADPKEARKKRAAEGKKMTKGR